MSYEEHYKSLFANLEKEHGQLDEETLTSIIGFSGGGAVSLCTKQEKSVFVSCELSAYQEQKLSSEGLRYEFLSFSGLCETEARSLFTAMGNLSMNAELGNNHTINVQGVTESGHPRVVKLHLYSENKFEGQQYGIYEVRVVS